MPANVRFGGQAARRAAVWMLSTSLARQSCSRIEDGMVADRHKIAASSNVVIAG